MIDGVQVVESGNVVLLTFIGRQWGLRLQNTNGAPRGRFSVMRDGDFSKVKQLLQNASTIEFKEQKIFPPFAACQRAITGNVAVDLIYPKDSIDLTADAVIADFLQLFA